jgi:hypothetical protein
MSRAAAMLTSRKHGESAPMTGMVNNEVDPAKPQVPKMTLNTILVTIEEGDGHEENRVDCGIRARGGRGAGSGEAT